MRGTAIGELFRRRRAANELQIATGVPADDIEARWGEQAREARELVSEARELPGGIDRRDFLIRAGRAGSLLAGTAALGSLVAACTPAGKVVASSTPSSAAIGSNGARIAIVGAGLAGLAAAYRLQQAGHAATVYEGNTRVGGRTYTLRDFFADDDTVELGAEFINSDHHRLRRLATELGLSLTDLWTSYPDGTDSLSWFDGRSYRKQEVNDAFDQMYPAAARDLKVAGYPMTFDRSTPSGRVLDRMTMAEWIEREVDGGSSSWFGTLVDIAYTGEYGLDPGGQSALKLMFEAGFSKPGDHKLFGYQDWRWRVEGGNDLIAAGLEAQLATRPVVMGSPLVAVRSNADGSTTLSFAPQSAATLDVDADIVIMALPFTTLRSVDLHGTDWSPLKRRVIAELGMGTNSKCQFQFSEPVWYDQGWAGDILTERPLQQMTVVYPVNGRTGILDNYKGGAGGRSYATAEAFGSVGEEIADPALDELDAIVPGTKERWNGKAYLSHWAANPWSVGSYSCPRPGQYATLFGAAGLPEGNVLFCGEHTSIDQWGFMEGAVETGERAAGEASDLLGERSAGDA